MDPRAIAIKQIVEAKGWRVGNIPQMLSLNEVWEQVYNDAMNDRVSSGIPVGRCHQILDQIASILRQKRK